MQANFWCVREDSNLQTPPPQGGAYTSSATDARSLLQRPDQNRMLPRDNERDRLFVLLSLDDHPAVIAVGNVRLSKAHVDFGLAMTADQLDPEKRTFFDFCVFTRGNSLLLRRRQEISEDLKSHVPDCIDLEPHVDKDLRRNPFVLLEKPEEDMLGSDDLVPELRRTLARELDHAFGAGGEGKLPERDRRRRRWSDQLLDLLTDFLGVDLEVLENPAGRSAAFLDDPKQHMLRADEFAVETLGFLPRNAHHFAGAFREVLEHFPLLLKRFQFSLKLLLFQTFSSDVF